jgi:predicted alpha/beta-fold hydrolase
MKQRLLCILLTCFFGVSLTAQVSNAELLEEIKSLRNQVNNMRHQFDQVDKAIDDVIWYNKVGDIAFIDKVRLTGPPLGDQKFKATNGRGNPLYYQNPYRIQTYLFIPKDIDPEKKYPLMVLPHGGVHSNFNTFYAHIIRELVAQQYIVVAPEYRGSTGYGRGYYEAIDYGGLEVEDVKACRDYMIESYDIVDEDRVGIMGWSHGGLITLMNLFDYGDDYQVGYAGVPVSDLIARMGYKSRGIGNSIRWITISARRPIKIRKNTNVAHRPGRHISWTTPPYWCTPIPMIVMWAFWRWSILSNH